MKHTRYAFLGHIFSYPNITLTSLNYILETNIKQILKRTQMNSYRGTHQNVGLRLLGRRPPCCGWTARIIICGLRRQRGGKPGAMWRFSHSIGASGWVSHAVNPESRNPQLRCWIVIQHVVTTWRSRSGEVIIEVPRHCTISVPGINPKTNLVLRKPRMLLTKRQKKSKDNKKEN